MTHLPFYRRRRRHRTTIPLSVQECWGPCPARPGAVGGASRGARRGGPYEPQRPCLRPAESQAGVRAPATGPRDERGGPSRPRPHRPREEVTSSTAPPPAAPGAGRGDRSQVSKPDRPSRPGEARTEPTNVTGLDSGRDPFAPNRRGPRRPSRGPKSRSLHVQTDPSRTERPPHRGWGGGCALSRHRSSLPCPFHQDFLLTSFSRCQET